MNVTVDPSVILAVVLNEPTRARLLESTQGAELQSAPSLPWEVGNALTALLKRRRIDLPQARSALAASQQVPIRLLDVDMQRALELADRHAIYAYDAYIIECARQQAAPLLSLDRRQREVAGAVGVEVVEVER